MKATRADVARAAGVSTATVSNVLNNAHKVKDETVARVMEAVERLNYQPDMVARSLSTRKTMQIGIVLEDIRNPLYGEVVEHFEAAANERGYFVNICTGAKELDNYLNNFITRGLDGAFVAALPYKFDADRLYGLLAHDIKLVVSGNIDVDFRRISSIENDYVTAMRTAIEYLVALGHEDIAYLSGLGRELSYDERCQAYLDTIQHLGLPCRDTLMLDGRFPYNTDVQAGHRQAVRLLESGKPFTAVICGNDLMAMGAIRAFSEKGLRVPADVSVIGFDGIALSRFYIPTLTTLAMEARAFGSKAFDLLHTDMIKNTTGFFRNTLALIEGESTARRK